MMRSTIVFLSAVLFSCSILGDEKKVEPEATLARYIWLERDGMYDPKVSNGKIHDMISTGLRHADPEIVDCTIGAMAKFIGLTMESRINGTTPKLDRRLQDVPDTYDILMDIWVKGWEKAGGVLPEFNMPEEKVLKEIIEERKGCLTFHPSWTSLPHVMAHLFPGDDRVYSIIWKAFPEPISGYSGGFADGTGNDPSNPLPLLSALYDGEFNNSRDRRIRVDLLLDRETIYHTAQLLVRSLGDLRSDEGLEALATVLQHDNMKYGTPKIPIIESMIKYEGQAAEYIPLMQESLEGAIPLNSTERDLKITLRERLVHFKKEYAEQIVDPLK